jgi:hypothetical protein
MGLDWFLITTGMTDYWREGRKLLDRSLRAGATMSYRPMMQEKTRWFLAQLFANPNNFHHHIELLLCLISYIVRSLMAGQTSREAYHVTHIWLRPERW